MGSYRTIRAQAEGDIVELWLLSEVTTWTSADFMMMADSYGNDKRYIININSPGGDPFAAFGIHDYMRAKGVKATARIYGHAASAAALIACACDRVEMGELSHLMIHNAYGGNNDDLLESLNAKQAEVFAAKTGKSTKEVRKMMDAETWMDAKEAKREGFADAVIKDLAIAALYKAQYMEEQTKPEGEAPEVKDEEAKTEEPKAEETPTEEVEVEIPVTAVEAVQAGFTGKLKAKVKVSGEMRAAVASLTDELKAKATELDEVKAEADGLREKLSGEADAKAKAEADLAAAIAERDALKAKAEEIAAALEKLKAAPIKAEAQPIPDRAVHVPAGGPSEGRATKEAARERKREEVQAAVDAVTNKHKLKTAADLKVGA